MGDPSRYTVLLISGSLRAGSTNTAALKTVQAVVPHGTNALLYERMADVPAFNPDDDHEPLPEPVADLRAKLNAADAACIDVPVRRDGFAADGTLSDDALRATIARGVAALLTHVEGRKLSVPR